MEPLIYKKQDGVEEKDDDYFFLDIENLHNLHLHPQPRPQHQMTLPLPQQQPTGMAILCSRRSFSAPSPQQHNKITFVSSISMSSYCGSSGGGVSYIHLQKQKEQLNKIKEYHRQIKQRRKNQIQQQQLQQSKQHQHHNNYEELPDNNNRSGVNIKNSDSNATCGGGRTGRANNGVGGDDDDDIIIVRVFLLLKRNIHNYFWNTFGWVCDELWRLCVRK